MKKYILDIALVALAAFSILSAGVPAPGSPQRNTLAAIGSNNAPTGNNTHTGAEAFKNLANVLYVDDANSQGWAGGDIGAWVNSAVAALPAAGGTIYITAPNGPTLTTTIADGGTRSVHFILGAANITCNVTAFVL